MLNAVLNVDHLFKQGNQTSIDSPLTNPESSTISHHSLKLAILIMDRII